MSEATYDFDIRPDRWCGTVPQCGAEARRGVISFGVGAGSGVGARPSADTAPLEC